MNNQNLLLLSQTIKLLEEIKHPDSYRIAKEILSFTKFNEAETLKIISQLETGKPWEQIRGWSEFYGAKIYISKDTLIPRVESAEMIDILKEDIDRVENIYDIGTGSGAIAIAIKRKYPRINVVASDISIPALEIARKNINSLKVDVTLVQSDLLENVEIEPNSLVVANLPYIPTSDYEELDKSVKDYEPKTALEGGKDGLDIIKRLLEQTRKNKNIKVVLLEIDQSQQEKLVSFVSGKSYKFYDDFRGLTRFFKLYL